MRFHTIFSRIAILLSGCFVFLSCVYDNFDEDMAEEVESPFTEGYSLNVMLTLDNMGGTRADNIPVLKEFENYIDPEKCRVLFFDCNDRFLFESKSRWVKQLAPGANGEQWMVSIPMYAYGNDVEQDWDWAEIRKVLTAEKGTVYETEYLKAFEARKEKARADGKSDEEIAAMKPVAFKIALLVNRPALEVYPDLETETKDVDGTAGADRIASNFDNSGPHWTREDTRFREGQSKTLFSLHHSQEDHIYRDKGNPTKNVKENGETVKKYWTDETGLSHFYRFIMEDVSGKLYLSATSSWVDYGPNNDDKGNRKRTYGSNTRRFARVADKDYPIPMYGLQTFDKINNWIEGVPFNLSSFTEGNEGENGDYDYQSVALLRSVVKLELVIPKQFTNGPDIDPDDIDFLALEYPNVYARCEPMDVWTPTNELWEHEGHPVKKKDANGKVTTQNGKLVYEDGIGSRDCEWFALKEHARIVGSEDTMVGESAFNSRDKVTGVYQKNQTSDKNNIDAYRRRLSWFYGAWLEKDWPFTGINEYTDGALKDAKYVEDIVKRYGPSPRIFNSCIQRNQRVYLDDLNCYPTSDGNYHFVVYMGERNSIDPNYIYYVDNSSSMAPTICYWHLGIKNKGTNSTDKPYYLYSFPIADYDEPGNAALRGVNNNVGSDAELQGYYTKSYRALAATDEPKNTNAMVNYATSMVSEANTDLIPWPLMRNHHYTITIGGITRAAANDNGLGFSVQSEVNYSETLTPSR